MKDAAQDVVQDVTQDTAQDLAEGLSGAAENCSVKVLILSIVIFQRRNPRPTHAFRPPHCLWVTREGRAREGCGAGSCGGRLGGRKGCGAGLGVWGPGGACPPRHATEAAAVAVFAQLALRWEQNWEAQWYFLKLRASASGAASH